MGLRGRTLHPAPSREMLGQAIQKRPHLSQVWKGKEGFVKWKGLERKVFGTKGTWELWKLSDMQEKVWPESRWAPEHHKSLCHMKDMGLQAGWGWAIQEVSHATLLQKDLMTAMLEMNWGAESGYDLSKEDKAEAGAEKGGFRTRRGLEIWGYARTALMIATIHLKCGWLGLRCIESEILGSEGLIRKWM